MIVHHYEDIPAEKVETGENTTIRWLISESEGAPHFYMRLIEIGPGGRTSHHVHEWEHEVFIIEGDGKLVGDTGEIKLTSGDAVFVPGNEIHHFESVGLRTMKMLCLIPAKHD